MTDYKPPLADMRFVLHELIGLERIAALPGCEQVDRDLVDAILDEAGKLARDVLAPLNKVGDTEGSRLIDGAVRTPTGFREAYQQFIAGGWSALTGDPDHGGQGLPAVVSAAVQEMWNSANMGFALCPLLSVGAIEALSFAGTDAQKALYLGKLIDGTWTGTMNLTEPQAGSDLAAVRTRAVPEGDHYRLFGQKIFITYGEHDFTDNIIHLVLARLPDAPEGVKGISLFLAPKFLVNSDGSLGARNDLRCVSLEHKLGIHASPTAVMAYGDHDGAIGYLLGEANHGLEYMFIMMNQERFGVGLQGVAISERAYQQALDYARDRVQGTETGVRGGARVPILRHPDVRRMLLSMKAETEAMRALAYVAAAAMDVGHRHADATERAQAQAMADLLIPVVKGCCTETALGITSTGIQVHGGMGFIEETGAAQHARDARILTIYEGTTGIQANDLVGRKIARDGGAAARVAIAEMRRTIAALDSAELAPIRVALTEAVALLERAVAWVVDTSATDARAVAAGAVPFLKLFGVVAGGWQMGRAAHVAQARLGAGDNSDPGFYRAKLATARFYADHVLPQAHGLAHAAMFGASSVLAPDDVLFAA
jgi:alkylation response protein AidB-like acyl-CoA dehydrogenase